MEQKIKQDGIIHIGQNIRRIRKERGIGQTELIGKLQLLDVPMTRETLVKIEREIQHIQASQLRAIRDVRSEERRVGKECRSRWSPYH